MRKIMLYNLVVAVSLCACAIIGNCADPESPGSVYNSKGKRDPFVPLIGQERSSGSDLSSIASPDDLDLEGIAAGAGGKQVAIINGQMVKEKDKFGPLLIKTISRKSVTISIEGKEYTLVLQETEKDNAVNKK